MTLKKQLPVTALFLIALTAWNTVSNSIDKASWLVGTWENKTPNGTIYESWKKVSATELNGQSYMLQGKDTVVFERIRLVEENNTLFYIPVVSDQNGGQPVRFALKTQTDKTLVFENKEHDFPNLISYTLMENNSIMAEISGTRNGKTKTEYFPMKKVK